MPFYPRLPDPTAVQPRNYVSDLIGSMSATQQLGTQAMKNETQALALQQYKDRQAAMKGYAETGDIRPVMQADPEFGLKLQGELRRMGAEERKEAVEALSKGADFMTKALPFISPQNYDQFYQDAMKVPILRGLVPKTYDPNWHRRAIQQTMDAKTAVAQVQAGWHREKNLVDAQYKAARLQQFDRGLELHAASNEETKLHHRNIENKPGRQGVDLYMKAYDKVAKTDAYRDEPDSNKRVKMVEDEYKLMDESRRRVGAAGSSAPSKGEGATYRVYNKRTGQYENVSAEQYRQIQQHLAGGRETAPPTRPSEEEEPEEE